jgi:hypothetical protein
MGEDVPNDVDNGPGQRKALLAFANAIAARRKLGQDEAGNPCIEGRHGRVYVLPSTAGRKTPTYQIYCFGPLQRLRNTKEALSRFLPLTNGRGADAEDCMFTIVGAPRQAFAEIMRDRLDVAKHKTYSEATLTAMRERMAVIRPKAPSSEAIAAS